MKAILLSGFLGSGKTSLLIYLLPLILKHARVVVIENEVGQIGIDGKYIEKEGIMVQEISGGCICCSASVDLVNTINQISQMYDPNLVLIESTGIAKPEEIVSNIINNTQVKSVYVITIVDVVRFRMIIEMLENLTKSQIIYADMLIVNKIDEVNSREVELVKKCLVELKNDLPVVALSIDEKININSAWEIIYDKAIK